MSVAEQMTEAQDRMLTGIEAVQTRMIEMNQRIAEAMAPVRERTADIDLPSVPGLGELPEPAEMIDRYFDFAAKMADANRTFYKEMVSVWTSPGDED